jgi:hypothetical protein
MTPTSSFQMIINKDKKYIESRYFYGLDLHFLKTQQIAEKCYLHFQHTPTAVISSVIPELCTMIFILINNLILYNYFSDSI